jgi:hypothetical protein
MSSEERTRAEDRCKRIARALPILNEDFETCLVLGVTQDNEGTVFFKQIGDANILRDGVANWYAHTQPKKNEQ